MRVFDEYSRNVICSYLTEQMVTLPETGREKEGQVFQQPGTKKRYVFSAGEWRLWPEGQPKPKVKILSPEEEEDRRQMIKYGTTGVPSGYELENQAMWWNYRNQLENAMAGITSGFIAKIMKAPKNVAKNVIDTGIDIMATRSGTKGTAAGKMQQMGKDALFNMVDTVVDPATQLAAIPIEFALKQAIKTAAAKVYLGDEDDFQKALAVQLSQYAPQEEPFEGGAGPIVPPVSDPNRWGLAKDAFDTIAGFAYKAIDPTSYGMGPGTGLKGLIGRGRLGSAGQREAKQIGKIAIMGKDPLEYALTRMGAKDAAETFGRMATTNVPSIETAAGALPTLRRYGIAK